MNSRWETIASRWDVRGNVKGFPVTLHEAETTKALSECPIRGEGKRQIYFDGGWRSLCRTDLKDDVCTDREPYGGISDGNWYGARVCEDAFAIIDSYSDG